MSGHYYRADLKGGRSTKHPGKYGLFVMWPGTVHTLHNMVESANEVDALVRAAGNYKPVLLKWIGRSVRIPEYDEVAYTPARDSIDRGRV